VTEKGEQGANTIRRIDPGAGIVVLLDHTARVLEDVALFLHDRVGRQAPL
jgi:hypothetical protein